MIYKRTIQGEAALTGGTTVLSIPHRRLLNLVDGNRDIATLQAVSHLSAFERTLNDLVEKSLISSVNIEGLATPTTQSPVAAGGVLNAAQMQRLQQVSRRFVLDQLGPDGESLAMRLERAADHADLLQAIEESRLQLARLRGRGVAEQFIVQTERARTA